MNPTIQQLLFNHTSPETAYQVDDYPYGFRLRCKIRYWLEYKKNKGFRFMSQTTNPKRNNDVFSNKPKASTYAKFGGAMYLDEVGHVQWSGLSPYADLAEVRAWVTQFGAAVPTIWNMVTLGWLRAKEHYFRQTVFDKIIEEQKS